MSRQVLITGGAGFIGSHVADELLACGYHVRAFDNLDMQVHGPAASGRPPYLAPEVEFVSGDVRDPKAIRRALRGVDAVFHFAACVGVGQSMYEIARYTDVNSLGTAVLLQALTERPVERLVIASSMSIYGEGMYCASDGMPVETAERTVEQLKARQWELCDDQGKSLMPVPTPETKQPTLASIYALSKYNQERMCLMVGRAYAIPTVALRFFNVYGTRQALSNPYTGVLAIFATRLLNDKHPMIFEDGNQQRDFVNVRDVAKACALALTAPGAAGKALNIGSGQHYTIRVIAEQIGRVLGKEHLTPIITGNYRVGDIRHCFADITLARQVLGYMPRVSLSDGLMELGGWLEGQAAVDRIAVASAELAQRGLTV